MIIKADIDKLQTAASAMNTVTRKLWLADFIFLPRQEVILNDPRGPYSTSFHETRHGIEYTASPALPRK